MEIAKHLNLKSKFKVFLFVCVYIFVCVWVNANNIFITVDIIVCFLHDDHGLVRLMFYIMLAIVNRMLKIKNPHVVDELNGWIKLSSCRVL